MKLQNDLVRAVGGRGGWLRGLGGRWGVMGVVLTGMVWVGGCEMGRPGGLGGGPPVKATANYAQGVIAYQAGNVPEARTKLIAATQAAPELIKARIILGDLFRAEGDYRAALSEYETVVKLDPYSPAGFYRLGLAYQFLQRFLEAKDAYLRALALKANDAETQMNLGLVYLALGDLPPAMEHTKRAVELAPQNADALANHGVVLDAVGDHVGAQRAFLASIEIAGDKPATLLNLAQNLLIQQRAAEAQEVLERFLAKSDSALARKRLGDALALQGQAEQAIEQYLAALKLDASYFPALNEAGRVMIQRYRAGKELDESLRMGALEYWRRSLKVVPNQPMVQALIRQWDRAKP